MPRQNISKPKLDCTIYAARAVAMLHDKLINYTDVERGINFTNIDIVLYVCACVLCPITCVRASVCGHEYVWAIMTGKARYGVSISVYELQTS